MNRMGMTKHFVIALSARAQESLLKRAASHGGALQSMSRFMLCFDEFRVFLSISPTKKWNWGNMAKMARISTTQQPGSCNSRRTRSPLHRQTYDQLHINPNPFGPDLRDFRAAESHFAKITCKKTHATIRSGLTAE